MRVRSIRGHKIEEVNKEIDAAIEEAYPIVEGKIYITLFNVVDHIFDSPDKFALLSSQKQRFLKALIHQYCTLNNWKQYTKSRGPAKSPVFVRPVSEGTPNGN